MSKKSIRKLEKLERCEYAVKLDTDRDTDKLIKRVERIVRSSMEYRDIMAYLRKFVDFDKCAFFNNVSKEDNTKIRIEIHHEPLTLYDIVHIVLNKWIVEGMIIDDLYIAEEVMELHYANLVGLIPLSKTIHQIVHNSNKIIIPIHMTYGNFNKFLEQYDPYVPDEVWDKIENKIEETKKLKECDYDPLSVEFTYLEIDGCEIPQRIETENKTNIETDANSNSTEAA